MGMGEVRAAGPAGNVIPNGVPTVLLAYACVALTLDIAGVTARPRDQAPEQVRRLGVDLAHLGERFENLELLHGRLERLVERLRMRQEMPRFWRHRQECARCRGDVQSEEGGPSPLCVEGFSLMQDDLREGGS